MAILRKPSTTPNRPVGSKGLIRELVRQGVRSDRSPSVARRRRRLHEPTLCERCGAVYSHKTWRTGGFAIEADPVGAFWAVCPACEQLRSGEYFGRVVIRGAYAEAHRDEIRRRVLNVVARARFTQPQRRLVSIEPRGEAYEVLTTSQKLAHRLVRELEKTFGGHGTLAWSERDGELYATWQREDVPAAPAPPRLRRIRGRGIVKPTPDVEIQTQHIALDPRWRDLIEGSVERLSARYPELIRIHITLRHAGHHRHGQEEVAILAMVPRATLRVDKQEEEVVDAIHAAFAALFGEFERYHRERKRFVKSPGPRPQGSIRRIFRDGGYGFIRLDRGQEVYFHRNALHELTWEALRPGLPVEVEVEEGKRGPQASRVFPVGERGRA